MYINSKIVIMIDCMNLDSNHEKFSSNVDMSQYCYSRIEHTSTELQREEILLFIYLH